MAMLSNRGKGLPDKDWIRANLLDETGNPIPGFAPYDLTDKRGKTIYRIHQTAHPELIWNILGDKDNDLSLSNYDRSLSNLSTPFALLLGEDQKQRFAWQVLARALALETNGNGNIDLAKPQSRLHRLGIQDLARKHCRGVLKALKQKRRFNMVSEYGFLIPYLVGKEFTGLNHARSFFGRRLNARKSSRKFLLFTLPMFGQIFGNFGNQNRPMKWLAGWAAKRYIALIKDAQKIDEPNTPEHTLIRRLRTVRDDFEPDTQNGSWSAPDIVIDEIIENLVLEVMTSFHILIGWAFSNMVEELSKENGDLHSFAEDLRSFTPKPTDTDIQIEAKYKASDALIDACLAKNSSTAMLFRIARIPNPKFGIKTGDALCFQIEEASKFVKDPHGMLSFGPHEKCPYHLTAIGERFGKNGQTNFETLHPCFGQFWARTVLREMFINLTDPVFGLPELRLRNKKMTKLKNIPIKFKFSAR